MPRLLAQVAAIVAATTWLLVLAPPAAAAGESGLAPLDDLILSLLLDRRELATAVPAATDGERVYLPLGLAAALLTLAVDVDADTGRATGFLIRESRGFELDLASHQVVIGGRRQNFDPHLVRRADGDLLVELGLLSTWLPVDFEHDAAAAAVRARAREKLPIQRRWERERALARLARLRDVDLDAEPVALPRIAFDGPFSDHVLRIESSPRRGLVVDHSTHLTAELLGMEAEAFVSGLGPRLVTHRRFTLGRRDPDGGLLGPFGAREVLIGSLLERGMDLVTRTRAGTGFRIDSRPLDLPRQFGAESLRGPLPIGWQVELYQDGALVDFQSAGPAQVYEFLDVPLHFGTNELKLVFHGPRGEEREHAVIRNVGSEMVPAGETYHRVSALRGDDGTRQALAAIDHGISSFLTISGGAAHVDTASGDRTYALVGLRGTTGRLLAATSLAADLDGGWAAEVGLHSRLGPVDLTARHVELHDFTSDVFAATDRLRRRSSLRVDARVPVAGGRSMPLSLEFSEHRHESGASTRAATLRFAASRRGFHVSSETAWRWAEGSLGADRAEGRVLVRQRLARALVRGGVEYDLAGGFEVTRVSLGADLPIAEGWFLRADLIHDLTRSGSRYGVSVLRSGGRFGIGGELSLADDGLTAAVTFRMGVARDSRSGRWFTQAEPLAGGGGLSAVAFLDLNANGVRDEGEPVLPDTLVRVTRTGVAGRTGEDGGVFLSRVPVHRHVALAVDPAALEEPLAMPLPAAHRLVARPGRVARIDLPVVLTGDVAGTVTVTAADAERPAGAVELQLVDRYGAVVLETLSAYDGFYNLTRIPPGDYVLRVAAESLARMDAVATAIELTVPGDGAVLDGVDVRLVIRLRPPETVAGDVVARGPQHEPRRALPSAQVALAAAVLRETLHGGLHALATDAVTSINSAPAESPDPTLKDPADDPIQKTAAPAPRRPATSRPWRRGS